MIAASKRLHHTVLQFTALLRDFADLSFGGSAFSPLDMGWNVASAQRITGIIRTWSPVLSLWGTTLVRG